MSTTYKNNYLKQVIYRLDFPKIDLGDLEQFKKSGDQQKYEYTLDSQKLESITFDAVADEVSKTHENIVVWRVEDKQKSMRFEATNQYCLLEYAQYVNSAKLKEDFDVFMSVFLKTHNVEEVSRMGLRYVNQIMFPSIKKIADWSKYISSELLSGTTFIQSKIGAPLRYLNQVEVNSSANSLVSVNFKYGIWNDKYPSPITSAEYILDIDCFTRSPISVSTDIESTYADLNKAAETVFEQAILEPLRKEMNK